MQRRVCRVGPNGAVRREARQALVVLRAVDFVMPWQQAGRASRRSLVDHLKRQGGPLVGAQEHDCRLQPSIRRRSHDRRRARDTAARIWATAAAAVWLRRGRRPGPVHICHGGIHWRAAAGTTPPAKGENSRVSTAAEGEVVELFERNADGTPRLLLDTRPVGLARCTSNESDFDVNHQCRLMYTSTDLGTSWGNGTFHPELPDPSCKGGIARWNGDNTSKGALFAVGAASSKFAGGVRTNTTLSWSTDGLSFPGRLQLDDSGGYSTVQITGEDRIAALYEAPQLDAYNCWAPCGPDGNASNGGTNCCTMAHFYQPPECPTDAHGTTLPNCTWLLDCACNPVGCGLKLARVDPRQLLSS